MKNDAVIDRYLIKNLRGIVYHSNNIDPKDEINWLKRKFKYRELGISENLKAYSKWKRLVVLPRIVQDAVLDSVLQASRFLCPLLVLKEQSLSSLENAIIARLRTNEKLSDKDLKFNIRLVNYAITDFYIKSIELGRQSNMESRKELAKKDLKRFWRIKTSEDGKTLIAYIDPLLMNREITDPTQMSTVPCLVLDQQA
jgi:hypothetical protein